MSEPICRVCKREYPKGWREAARRRKSERLKASLAKAVRRGRPRLADPERIRKLRKAGRTLREISTELKISRGAVQYALREVKERV